MRFFETLRTANHNLFRNKVRTFLTILAIFVGSFTIILNVAINSGVNAFIDEQTAALGGDNFIMLMSKDSAAMMSEQMSASTGPQEFTEKTNTIGVLSDTDLETLKNIDGIDADSFYSPTPLNGTGYITSSKTDKKYNVGSAMILPQGTSTSHLPLVLSSIRPRKPSKRTKLSFRQNILKPSVTKKTKISLAKPLLLRSKMSLTALSRNLRLKSSVSRPTALSHHSSACCFRERFMMKCILSLLNIIQPITRHLLIMSWRHSTIHASLKMKSNKPSAMLATTLGPSTI